MSLGHIDRILAAPARLEALRRTRLLDTPPEECFDRLTRLAARILDAPVALCSLTDERRHFFKSQFGLPEPHATRRERPLALSFCQRALAREEPLVIEDASNDSALCDHPAVRDFGIGGYLGAPLITSDGWRLGTFCVIDQRRRRWSKEQVETVRDLARAAVSEIELGLRSRDAEAARAEAETALAMARDANRAKDTFLAMLGHELRNPLAPIVTALDVMELRGADLFVDERAVIRRQARHLSALLEDLMDVSRLTRGKVEMERVPTDVARVVRMGVELAGRYVEVGEHELHVDVASGAMVLGDEHRLAQVVSNLVGNAAKHTPPGGRIEVSSIEEADAIVVRVRDYGRGIEPSLLDTVFEPFVQGHPAHDGLGLGLAVVRGIVELHGGSVSVSSAGPGLGTSFTVRLPRLANGSERLAPAAASPVYESRPRRRVLVVDDNRDAADMLGEALRSAGHEVVVAYDGARALELASHFRPQVALVDLHMPTLDGYAVAARLPGSVGFQPLMIAVSGYGQEMDRERTRAAGFDGHLVKPTDLTAVLEMIESHGERIMD